MEFSSLTIVSVIVIILMVRFSLRQRYPNPTKQLMVLLVLSLLAIVCMAWERYTTGFGLPWWIYYPVPLLLTLLFPIFWFRMKRSEALTYFLLTILAAPVSHILYSLLGWKEFMPFIQVPSLLEMLPKV
ncbi:hypothetical protein [Prolixibacter denitrificans]|uniref:Histidine kinase N-terminal 7TM region domain-containing protein n=1 Tax=Prolixibacter denitrificans TaxID=1541063 RepID=A0A2P8CF93_9BACT|nr:hypothetical protein [Prolixibacter denitrificans]PSK83657.1 hypothetical protein CLV93_10372 [Prolixibacter denitrificans]GET23204.1 hypothetical protein JCM18694_34500 [Prolixibacter denitrificans]